MMLTAEDMLESLNDWEMEAVGLKAHRGVTRRRRDQLPRVNYNGPECFIDYYSSVKWG